jgi:hypothetical protein
MQVSLRMSPGLEMWFGEWGWIDEEWFEERLEAGYMLVSAFRFIVRILADRFSFTIF